MKARFSTLAAVSILFLGHTAALAQEGSIERPASAQAVFNEAQSLLAGEAGDALPSNQEMFNRISNFVELTKSLSPKSASTTAALEFGKPYEQIGTFNNWTMWIGWNGSFSETYIPESESYAWVVYFAPEGVYVALQSGKARYSGVNVYGSVGYFWGALVSPNGAILKKQYIKDLLGVSISWSNSFNPVAYGPLSNFGMSFEKGLTFFRLPNSVQLKRGVQYNGGFTVSYDLIPMPLPGSVSLDYESNVDAGFYPIIDWRNLNTPAGNPIDVVAAKLQILSTKSGTSLVSLMGREFAKMLLPFFSNLKAPAPGPVIMSDTDLPTTAEFVKHFLQNNRATIPATAPKPSADRFIMNVQKWLASGKTGQLSESVESSRKVLADPPDVFKRLGAGVGIGFEIGYKHGSDHSSNPNIYANCVKKLSCGIGKTCSIPVAASEIAALLPGSKAANFEGALVSFNNPSEKFLATGDNSTNVSIRNGKAVFSFVQSSNLPTLIGPQLGPSAVTNNKIVKLCRWLVEVPSTLPTVSILASKPNASEAGSPGMFTLKRTGSTSKNLVVKYLVGGSATSAKDYTAFPSYKTIPAGSASIGINISPLKDTLKESAETVVIRLSNDPAYNLDLNSKATVAIANTP